MIYLRDWTALLPATVSQLDSKMISRSHKMQMPRALPWKFWFRILGMGTGKWCFTGSSVDSPKYLICRLHFHKAPWRTQPRQFTYSFCNLQRLQAKLFCKMTKSRSFLIWTFWSHYKLVSAPPPQKEVPEPVWLPELGCNPSRSFWTTLLPLQPTLFYHYLQEIQNGSPAALVKMSWHPWTLN